VGAIAMALAVGASAALAADYQDERFNVCEGRSFSESCQWGTHVTGAFNTALGADQMPNLTSGRGNVAIGFDALDFNTEGSGNVASGRGALQNTLGNDNVASGERSLFLNVAGNNNVALGQEAGSFTEGSNNIDISNAGQSGDESTTRIGT